MMMKQFVYYYHIIVLQVLLYYSYNNGLRNHHVNAFHMIPNPSVLHRKSTTTTTTTTSSSRLYSNVSAQTTSSSTATATYDTYQPGITREIVYKDIGIVDMNDTTNVAKFNDVVVISYTGIIMETQKKFNSNNDYVFQIGTGQTLPGFDDGLIGVRPNMKRYIRVPPNRAFGVQGTYDGRIPPNANLQYEVDIKRVISYENNQLVAQLALFGEMRALGLLACLAVAAIPPMIL